MHGPNATTTINIPTTYSSTTNITNNHFYLNAPAQSLDHARSRSAHQLASPLPEQTQATRARSPLRPQNPPPAHSASVLKKTPRHRIADIFRKTPKIRQPRPKVPVKPTVLQSSDDAIETAAPRSSSARPAKQNKKDGFMRFRRGSFASGIGEERGGSGATRIPAPSPSKMAESRISSVAKGPTKGFGEVSKPLKEPQAGKKYPPIARKYVPSLRSHANAAVSTIKVVSAPGFPSLQVRKPTTGDDGALESTLAPSQTHAQPQIPAPGPTSSDAFVVEPQPSLAAPAAEPPASPSRHVNDFSDLPQVYKPTRGGGDGEAAIAKQPSYPTLSRKGSKQIYNTARASREAEDVKRRTEQEIRERRLSLHAETKPALPMFRSRSRASEDHTRSSSVDAAWQENAREDHVLATMRDLAKDDPAMKPALMVYKRRRQAGLRSNEALIDAQFFIDNDLPTPTRTKKILIQKLQSKLSRGTLLTANNPAVHQGRHGRIIPLGSYQVAFQHEDGLVDAPTPEYLRNRSSQWVKPAPKVGEGEGMGDDGAVNALVHQEWQERRDIPSPSSFEQTDSDDDILPQFEIEGEDENWSFMNTPSKRPPANHVPYRASANDLPGDAWMRARPNQQARAVEPASPPAPPASGDNAEPRLHAANYSTTAVSEPGNDKSTVKEHGQRKAADKKLDLKQLSKALNKSLEKLKGKAVHKPQKEDFPASSVDDDGDDNDSLFGGRDKSSGERAGRSASQQSLQVTPRVKPLHGPVGSVAEWEPGKRLSEILEVDSSPNTETF